MFPLSFVEQALLYQAKSTLQSLTLPKDKISMYYLLNLYTLLIFFIQLAAGLHSSSDQSAQNNLKSRVSAAEGHLNTRSIRIEKRGMLKKRIDVPRTSPSQQRLFARTPPVHLKLKAKEDAAVKNIVGSAGRQFHRLSDKDWKHSAQHEPVNINRKHPLQAAGIMSTKTDSGESSGKIKGPEVRAEMGTWPGARSMVTVKDPSKMYYPSGRHMEIVAHDSPSTNMESKDFRASSRDPYKPASIKVKTFGKSSTTFEAAPNLQAYKLNFKEQVGKTLPHIPNSSK